MRKPRGYWNYERCFEEAQKYKTRMDFKNGSPRAYSLSAKKKWIDDYKWFELLQLPNGYWTYERCFEEASKYSLMKDFSKQSSSAHSKASKEGWLKDYIWLQLIGKPKGHWNDYQNCYDEAKKYYTLRDFEKSCPAAVRSCRKNGWLKDFTWFESKHRKPGSWDYNRCYNAAKECKTLAEFYTKYAGAYDKAMSNNWIEDYSWLEKAFRWTYETCCEESKKYNSRSEFCEKCVGGYTRALDKGWLDDFIWLKNEHILSEEVDSIYGYFFEGNVVYIGRTLMRTQNKRHNQHVQNESDTVCRYARVNNVEIPQMTILEENLTVKEGSKREGYWVDYYKKQKFIVLNRCKTGGIGGLGRGKWNKKTCYKEALKYKTLDEFYTYSGPAYNKANENGWIEEYNWLERKHTKRGYWQDYNNCFNEAKKYDGISEFQKNAPGAYNSACDNGWIDDYTWFVRNTSKTDYTYDICYALAKKCENISQFIKESSTAFRVARENGWIKDYEWIKEKVRWTDEKVLELASRFSTATDFRKANSGAYNYMLKHSLPQPDLWKVSWPKWTYKTCYEEAKKYKKRSEYNKNSKTSYVVARDKGWLNDFTWLEISSKPHGYWTYDRCHEEAKKYKTKREFEKGCPGAYDAVISHKWMADFDYIFVDGQKPKGYWNNYDNCYEEAKKYSKVSHFKKGCIGAYTGAMKNGWLSDYKWFKKNNGQLDLFDSI